MPPGPTGTVALMPGWEFIQNPGPTNIPDEVLAAMARRPVDFASPAFMELVDTCTADLRELCGLDGPGGDVFLYASLGHGAWEATLVNLFEPGDVVLLPETGVFAVAWGQMAADLGLELQVLPTDWRSAIRGEDVEAALRADREGRIRGVLITHTETATGVTSDLTEVRDAIRAAGHPAFSVVDAVASLGTAPLHMNDMGIDVVITASQKGLTLSPGLAFTAVSERALAHSHTVRRPRAYWSWPPRHAGVGYQKFCGTPPIQQLFGLRAGLDLLRAEGLEQVIARHHRLAGAVRAAVEVWSGAGALEFNATVADQRSDAVTCVRVAEGSDPDALRTLLRDELHVSIGGGLGPLLGRAFRIGHLGALNEPMVLGVVAALELALARCGIPYEPGGATAAIDHLVKTSPR
jgi:alanine-glyoxylate transaminase/serine-glyoxylate transaminase/serine-pyruvate transaminase